MRIHPTLLIFMASLISLTLVQAMFFTSSKENDYPRLGKRIQPLPKYVYSKWLRMSDSRNVYSYDPGSREMMYPTIPIQRVEDLSDESGSSELLDKDIALISKETPKRDSFYKTLQFYLSLQPEEFF